MIKKSFFVIFLFFSLICNGQKLPKVLETGDFVIGKTLKIKSKVLDEVRNLNIYLPESYSKEKEKHYPVIYLLDGSKDEDFIHVSGIVQFGSFPWINMLPESIVVGIANVDRKRDFTYPSKNELDQKEFTSSGQSEKFMDFIEDEVQPLINDTFRITDTTTIIGQSLGGLLATEILFKRPELFKNYIIVSPSLWWDDERLIDFNPKVENSSKGVYIAVGSEGPVMERVARSLYKKLENVPYTNMKLIFDFFEDKAHGDALHEAVYYGLEKLF